VEKVPIVLGIDEIKSVTFYQWIALRHCALQGMLEAVRTDVTLPEPIITRATLIGRFHHRLMELAVKLENVEELERRIEAEILHLQAQVNDITYLRQAGSVSGWDEINKSARLATKTLRGRAKVQRNVLKVEKDLRSRNGLLVGRPDLFSISSRRALLREYKSGDIRESGGEPNTTYLEQVRFYAALIFDNYEVDCVSARVEALSGDGFELDINLAEVNEFQSLVGSVVSALNKKILDGCEINTFASPSGENCAFCKARIICSRFKQRQDQLELSGEQLLCEGIIEEIVPNGEGHPTIKVLDEHRRNLVSIDVPLEVAVDLSRGRRIALTNLRKHGSTLRWGHTSSVFRHD
jgi:hypothetical protein